MRNGLAIATLAITIVTAACAPMPPTVRLQPLEAGVALHYQTGDGDRASKLAAEIAAFSTAAPEVGPMAGELAVTIPAAVRKSMYPVAADVGHGDWLLYAPALFPDCLGVEKLSIEIPERASRRVTCRPGAYVFTGESHDLRSTAPAPGGSAIEAAIEGAAATAMETLERKLGPVPAESSWVAVTISANAPSGIVGHVDRAGTVLFEVRPAFAASANEDVLRTQVRPLLRHELFHRWNMSGVSAADDVPAWFYEGAAEYAGGLLSLQAGDFSPAEYNWLIGAMLNRCLAVSGSGGLSRAEQGRALDYDCGAVASWILDLDLRQHGTDYFRVWRALIESADAAGRGMYDATSIETVLKNGRWRVPTWRLFTGGVAPSLLADALTAAGARVTYQSGAADYRRALLHPLLKANCTSRSYGFFDDPSGVTLDMDTVCPALPGGARISLVAGVDVTADAAGAFQAALAACERGPVVPVLANGSVVSLKCAEWAAPNASFEVQDAGLRAVTTR